MCLGPGVDLAVDVVVDDSNVTERTCVSPGQSVGPGSEVLWSPMSGCRVEGCPRRHCGSSKWAVAEGRGSVVGEQQGGRQTQLAGVEEGWQLGALVCQPLPSVSLSSPSTFPACVPCTDPTLITGLQPSLWNGGGGKGRGWEVAGCFHGEVISHHHHPSHILY